MRQKLKQRLPFSRKSSVDGGGVAGYNNQIISHNTTAGDGRDAVVVVILESRSAEEAQVVYGTRTI